MSYVGSVSVIPENLYGLYSARPSAGIAGRTYTSSDGKVVFFDNGSSWQPTLMRGFLGTQPPAASNFTKTNATTATIVDSFGTLVYTSATTNELFTYGTALGSTFQVDCVYETLWNTAGGGHESMFAICAKNSGGNSFERYGVYFTTGGVASVQRQDFSNVTTSSGGALATINVTSGGPYHLRMVQDSTNLTYSFSTNGIDFIQVYQRVKAFFVTANQLALFTNDTLGNTTVHTVYSLKIA